MDRVAWAIYLAGVVVGLLRTDASPAARVALAVVWPLGALAFVVTVATLVAALLVLFPVAGAVAAAAALILWAVLG